MANPQVENGYVKISNELFEEYLKISRILSSYENAVFLCIIRKTYGYNKKEDWISLSQIKEMTNIKQSHIARTIKKLKNKNMITHTGEKGKTYMTGINKNYSEWSLLPKQVIPKQVIALLPKQVTTITQAGNQLLPKQVDTKDNIQKTYIKDNIHTSAKTADDNKEYLLKDNISKVLYIYKILKNVSPEPVEQRKWDKLNYKRFSKSAKLILDYFDDDYKKSADCVKWVKEKLEKDNLNWTLETVVKYSAEYKIK